MQSNSDQYAPAGMKRNDCLSDTTLAHSCPPVIALSALTLDVFTEVL